MSEPFDAAQDLKDAPRGGGAQRPKDAATLILTRGGRTPEVLMGRRAPGHVFMASKWVFPGGRIDEGRAEQQRRLGEHLRGIDGIVCTAAVPGRPAPKIVTAAMVAGMKPGSVIVDLAAETGGNCELTRPGETFDANGVTVAGPLNLASMGAVHASEMYARNVLNFVSLFVRDGAMALDWSDELLAKTVWPERAVAAPAVVPATG